MVEAVSIDPYTRQLAVVQLPSATISEDTRSMLAPSATPEGCHEEDFQTVADFLGIPSPMNVNAYLLWSKRTARAVLFTGMCMHKRPSPNAPPSGAEPALCARRP